MKLRRTKTGRQIKTWYIERLNPTFRAGLAALVRRGRALVRQEGTLEKGMYLVGCVYNFCTEHKSLGLRQRRGKKWLQRTPAMAAGWTDHVWSVGELVSFRLPVPLHGLLGCYRFPPPPKSWSGSSRSSTTSSRWRFSSERPPLPSWPWPSRLPGRTFMTSPHTILFGHASSLLGGANVVLLRLLERIDRRHFTPRSVIPAPGLLQDELRDRGVPCSVVDLRVGQQSCFRQALGILKLFLLHATRRPRLVHANEMTYRPLSFGIPGARRVCHI